jgi:hypothetical protein
VGLELCPTELLKPSSGLKVYLGGRTCA